MIRMDTLKIFWHLFKTDLIVLKASLYDDLINVIVWSGTIILITRYLMPAFGLSISYGAFFAAGAAVSAGNFELYSNAAVVISDLEGDRQIEYHLGLPISAWLLFVKMALVSAIKIIIMGFCSLLVAKLILMSDFPLTEASCIKTIISFVGMSLFFGFFVLFLASYIPSMHKYGNAFMRIQFPLWFFGGFQFSWQTAYNVHPLLGYLALFNPYMVAIEGMRIALLGQKDYLPFWLCMLMLAGFTLLFAFIAVRRFKRRLDFV